jgi:uncharacterized protein
MTIPNLLKAPKTIAVIGLSDKPERPSYQVATYLLDHGFTIIPVNPALQEWKGIHAYPTLLEIPHDTTIDIVDIFRDSSSVVPIVQEVINSARAPYIWMQEGVINEEARDLALRHSLEVNMDTCIMKTHKKLAQTA